MLTERGEALFPILMAMQQWGDKWIYGGEDAPEELYDTRTGEQLAPIQVANRSGEEVTHRDVASRERARRLREAG